MKFNYCLAGDIFADFFNLCIDPWTLGTDEKQKERREFMRALTRGDEKYIQLYLDYIEEEKNIVCKYDTGTSKYFDFDLMKEYDAIIKAIKTFNN